MIETIKHKGLKRLFVKGDRSQVRADLREKVEDILAVLNVADKVGELDLPGYQLHPLKGKLKGFWSVALTGNYRIIFRFAEGKAYDVDLMDYH